MLFCGSSLHKKKEAKQSTNTPKAPLRNIYVELLFLNKVKENSVSYKTGIMYRKHSAGLQKDTEETAIFWYHMQAPYGCSFNIYTEAMFCFKYLVNTIKVKNNLLPLIFSFIFCVKVHFAFVIFHTGVNSASSMYKVFPNIIFMIVISVDWKDQFAKVCNFCHCFETCIPNFTHKAAKYLWGAWVQSQEKYCLSRKITVTLAWHIYLLLQYLSVPISCLVLCDPLVKSFSKPPKPISKLLVSPHLHSWSPVFGTHSLFIPCLPALDLSWKLTCFV